MLKPILLAITISLFTACGAADTNAPVAPVVPFTPQPSLPAAVSISINTQGLTPGQTAVVTARVSLANGEISSTGAITWTSSDPSVASLTPSGVRAAIVTALKPGSAEITGTIGNVSGKIAVPVSAPVTIVRSTGFVYTEAEGFVLIPAPAGAVGIEPQALNDAGQVVGRILFQASGSHAFLWTRTDGLKDLGTMPGSSTPDAMATAISENGQVVGWARVTSGDYHAFRWTPATGMNDLGTLPGARHSFASGVNNAGDVVGSSNASDGLRPFRWSAERGMETLTADAASFGQATAINESGQVAGVLTLPGDPYPLDYAGAVMWTASGVKTDIVKCSEYPDCQAASYAINSSGFVVGTTGSHAFIWTNEGMKLVPGVPTGGFSAALAINDSETVVGMVFGAAQRGFIWSQSGGYRELHALNDGAAITLTDVNNKNQIVGYFQ